MFLSVNFSKIVVSLMVAGLMLVLFFGLASKESEAAQISGGVAHWGFDDGESVTEDASGNGNAGINDNQWHHIAATYDGANLSLYIDGVLDATQPTGWQRPTPTATPPRFLLKIAGESFSLKWRGIMT